MSTTQTMRLTDFVSVDMTVAKVGAGGFGVVFMGPDRLSKGLWSALKTLRPELLALHPDLSNLFLQECLTWNGLWPHPNLLSAYGITLIDGHIFLKLVYAEQGSLRDLLPLNIPFTRRLRWAQQIAAGLQALHTPDPEFLRPFPLVHRDLKPENVLVSASGDAMITDFGLAASIGTVLAEIPEAQSAFALIEHLAEQAAEPSATGHTFYSNRATRTTRYHVRAVGKDGTPSPSSAHMGRTPAAGLGGVGTIAYMPPEQWVQGSSIGTPADLYAFGIILSEILAGRHGLGDLETDISEYDWYLLHLNGTPRSLRSGSAEGASRLPQEVEDLYHALLAKRPELRPSASEALAVLRQAAIQLGEVPYTPEVVSRTDELRLLRWTEWAIAHRKFGLFAKALECNSRALNLDPRGFGVLNTQGNIIGDIGQQAWEAGHVAEGIRLQEEALGWYSQALVVATTNEQRAMALSQKASRLSMLGQYAEAEAAYGVALALMPKDGVKWSNRTNNAVRWAEAEIAVGRRQEALRACEMAERYARKALRLRPNHPTIRSLLISIKQARAWLRS